MEEYDERLAREYLVYPDKKELKSFEDIKRKNRLMLFAMNYQKKVCKLGKKMLKDKKIYSGTKEQVKDNLKYLNC